MKSISVLLLLNKKEIQAVKNSIVMETAENVPLDFISIISEDAEVFPQNAPILIFPTEYAGPVTQDIKSTQSIESALKMIHKSSTLDAMSSIMEFVPNAHSDIISTVIEIAELFHQHAKTSISPTKSVRIVIPAIN